MPLKLGMPKDAVIATLATQYRVEPAGGEEWWSVDAKQDQSVHVGNLGFESGRLIYVLKRHFYTDKGTGAFALANALHVVLTAFLHEQGNACSVSTSMYDALTNETKRMAITCGRKTLTMEAVHLTDPTGAPDWVMIEESLGAPPR